jgi:hypothetical protein
MPCVFPVVLEIVLTLINDRTIYLFIICMHILIVGDNDILILLAYFCFIILVNVCMFRLKLYIIIIIIII